MRVLEEMTKEELQDEIAYLQNLMKNRMKDIAFATMLTVVSLLLPASLAIGIVFYNGFADRLASMIFTGVALTFSIFMFGTLVRAVYRTITSYRMLRKFQKLLKALTPSIIKLPTLRRV